MPHPLPKRITAQLVAASLFAAAACAQSPAGPAAVEDHPVLPELVQRRAQFAASLRKLLEPLNRSYVSALKKAERELAVAGDYEGAIAARTERLAVAEILIASQIDALSKTATGSPPADAPPVDLGKSFTLKASAASASEGVTVIAKGATIGAAGDELVWELPEQIPGGFDISITYSCTGTASFWIRESFFRLKGEVGAGRSATVNLGPLKITAAAESITLQAIDIPADGISIEALTFTETPD